MKLTKIFLPLVMIFEGKGPPLKVIVRFQTETLSSLLRTGLVHGAGVISSIPAVLSPHEVSGLSNSRLNESFLPFAPVRV